MIPPCDGFVTREFFHNYNGNMACAIDMRLARCHLLQPCYNIYKSSATFTDTFA